MTAESVKSVPMEDIGDKMAKGKHGEDSKGIIVSRTVKRFGNGGAFVSVPVSLEGQEVWIVPKDQIESVNVTLKGKK